MHVPRPRDESLHDLRLDGVTSPEEPDAPDLSREEAHLLKEAAKDPRGTVTMTKNMHAFEISAHGMQLVDGGNPRVEATYRTAIKNLVSRGLLEERGDKGEAFALTSEGWPLAEKLNSEGSE